MKNKLFKTVFTTVLCATLITPVFPLPVFASEDGKHIIFEDEEPFTTALWGKYSKFDGKLVYRISGVKDVDFYTEDVEEIKAYGFKITGEYTNERGEKYFKFKYVGIENNESDNANETSNEESVIACDVVKEIPAENVVTSDVVIEISNNEESVVACDIVKEIPAQNVVASDVVIEISDEEESVVACDIVKEIPVENVVASDVVIEISDEEESVVACDVVKEIPAENAIVTFDDSEISLFSEDGKEIIFEDEDNATGHCESGKEIIWEKPLAIYEEAEEDTINDIVWEI